MKDQHALMKEKNYIWKVSSGSLSLLLALPVLAIFWLSLGDDTEQLFSHLFTTVMPAYIYNTTILVSGVIVLTLILGVPAAWLMAMCRLPGERVLQWALVLPLAMPGYVIGYIFTDWFDFAGPIQVWLREITGWQAGDYWFPELRSLGGAIVILALVLYPYVYLMSRAAFMEQSVNLLQSARLLKCSPAASFRRVSLPLARPAIAVGLSLVAMETIGDFGTVSYFSVNTLTTAVYDTWLGYSGSGINAAAKISAVMLLVVVMLLSAERYSRRKQQQFQSSFNSHEDMRYQLHGWKKWAALIWCWGLVSAAFLFPFGQLLIYAYQYFEQSWTEEFRQYAINSLQVSSGAAFVTIVVALVVNFNNRLHAGRASFIFMRLSSLGYAVPGTVLAIGVLIPVSALEHGMNDVAKYMEWGRPGLLLSGSVFALIFAMVVRFSAIAVGSIESSLGKISPSLDIASRVMGCSSGMMLRRVHFPLVRRGILVAGLVVFIESMKELNAALLLRPFNFETLATYVYNFVSDEYLELGALPAVLLILVGLLPLIVINRSLEKAH